MYRKYLAEFIGTFILVFAGTSAIALNDLSGGGVTHIGIALVFGLAVTAIIYTFGDISGAHINPAVTVAFWYAKQFRGKYVLPYVLSQLLGAVSASILVRVLFMQHDTLGATLPAGTLAQSFILELFLTFVLILTIINVAAAAKEIRGMAGVIIGGVVGLGAWFGGSISGASMNPARSIGPALISGHARELWLYICAPILGAWLAITCCRHLRKAPCCR